MTAKTITANKTAPRLRRTTAMPTHSAPPLRVSARSKLMQSQHAKAVSSPLEYNVPVYFRTTPCRASPQCDPAAADRMRNTGYVNRLEWAVYDPCPDMIGGLKGHMYIVSCRSEGDHALATLLTNGVSDHSWCRIGTTENIAHEWFDGWFTGTIKGKVHRLSLFPRVVTEAELHHRVTTAQDLPTKFPLPLSIKPALSSAFAPDAAPAASNNPPEAEPAEPANSQPRKCY
ncbi:uncharacterized protein PHACADRAFT_33464 [Phanerochaete carnosa HHB-10118-sp]|uniref:Uncharacterized protein n=1 Tax=Phanerochaete carnosa (strain HHB-10118-sp) TaxID=650164 RepID=K5UIQ8_PHACS|nr:uncharacterized protein PHACADRAFT_33464 [Phanerochaete carnosa HHB-10118-sp]EKM49401.1 hypothetical protein PHACADRAFT_33464 [Phanerochaete carnosa HHB-10118-sp]